MLDIPEWTVALYDVNDNEIMDISRFVNIELDLKLNDVSTLRFEMDLVQFEMLCASVGALPRNVLYPALTEVKVFRNDNPIFGGIVANVTSRLGQDRSILTVTADSYIQYFATRLLSKTYTNTDRSQIAWDAIDTVQSLDHGDLGITQGTLATTFNSDLTADFRDVKSIIQLYTYAQPTTYDFEITHDKVFNTYTHLGSTRPEYQLTYPGNIVSLTLPRSSDTLFNRVVGIGSGIGEERLQTIQEDETSKATYRIRESKQLYSSVIEQGTLEQNTQGFLEQSKGVLVLPDVQVNADAFDLDIVRVGDSLPVRVIDGSYNNDLDGTFRIYQMNVQVDENAFETVRLNFYRPDLGGELGDI